MIALQGAERLREMWEKGRPAFGAWLSFRDPFAAEVIGRAGFDWACVDLQHGMMTASDTVDLLRSLAATGTAALVRVPWNDPPSIMRALDSGADGVIVPMVNSAAEAENAARACRYPPRGVRSWGPTRVALGTPAYSSTWANDRIICAVMVETLEGLERLDEILAVDGVDAVFIGPSDLALAYGDERNDPKNFERIDGIFRSCLQRRRIVGIATVDSAEARKWSAAGARLLALASDSVLLMKGCFEALAQARGESPVASAIGSDGYAFRPSAEPVAPR